jgi:transglutaminase-like putative cysteine protease
VGSEARTRIGLAGVLAVTLLSLSQLFEGTNHFGPILLAMLIAAAIAIGGRRLGIGTITTILASAAALLLYVSFIFATPHTLYGLPTPDAVAHLNDAVRNAIDKSEVDFAPIPARTGYVVMFVIALWAATTIGEIATFRWKRPLVASTPVVALFSVVMVVGKPEAAGFFVALFLVALLTYWGLESSHRLRSWGRWVTTWSGVDEDEPASVTGALARRMGILCVVAALASPLLLPALDRGLLAWRSGLGGGGGSGLSGGGQVNPYVDIAPRLLNQTGVRLFTAHSEQRSYWRLQTLVAFDGRTWSPFEDADQATDGFIGWNYQPLSAREIEARITINSLQSEFLPAAPMPVVIEPDGNDRVEDLRYGPETGDVRIENGVGEGFSYEVSAQAPLVSYADMLNAEPAPDFVAPMYSALPDDAVGPDVRSWLDETIAGAPTPYQELVAIQQRLRSNEFTYSLGESGAPEAPGDDYLTNFLVNTKTGFCQQFATAFAVMARELGYPTRLVVGFLPGENTANPGERIVRGTDTHVWPEVYFGGFGWIPFEPTPRNETSRVASAPAYTVPPASPGENPETNGFLPTDPAPGLGGQLRPERDDLSTGGGEGRVDPQIQSPAPRPTPEWARTFGRVAIILLVAGLLFLLTVPALKEWRIRRRYAAARNPRDVAAAAFEEFLFNASELASMRSPAETARAYVRRIAELRGMPEMELMRLASIYEASEYSAVSIDDAEASEARKLTSVVRNSLWRNASWWNRAVRMFSVRAKTSSLHSTA